MITQKLPQKWDLKIQKGAEFSFKVQWLTREKTPQVNLAEFDVVMTIRESSGKLHRFTSNPEKGIVLLADTCEIEIEIPSTFTRRLSLSSQDGNLGSYDLILTPRDSSGPIGLLYGKIVVVGV